MNPTSANAQAVKEAVRQAVTTGAAAAEVRRIVEQAAADTASSAGEWDFLLAPILFALALDARREGQDHQADVYTRLNVEWCRPEAVKVAKLGGLLASGKAQGWLPCRQYDEVAALLDEFAETSPHRATLAAIERREL